MKHLTNGAELVLMNEITKEKILRKLNGDLPDILRGAIMLLPDMLQLLTRNKRKIEFPDHLYGVTHNAPDAFGIFYIVDLELAVRMQGVSEFRFSSIGNVETIPIR
jgi:hypothetical protein